MLFFHMQYYPYDIPRNIVRIIYAEECEDYFRDYLDIQRYIIEYSRPEKCSGHHHKLYATPSERP